MFNMNRIVYERKLIEVEKVLQSFEVILVEDFLELGVLKSLELAIFWENGFEELLKLIF